MSDDVLGSLAGDYGRRVEITRTWRNGQRAIVIALLVDGAVRGQLVLTVEEALAVVHGMGRHHDLERRERRKKGAPAW